MKRTKENENDEFDVYLQKVRLISHVLKYLCFYKLYIVLLIIFYYLVLIKPFIKKSAKQLEQRI